MKLGRVFTMLGVIALSIVACVPEDGETGPAGPVGPEGPIGPAGAGADGQDGQDGTNGVDGKDGVANIQALTFFLDSATWTMPTGENGIVNSINVPEITSAVVSNGTVMLFQTEDNSLPSSTIWTAVPYTDGIFSYLYSYSLGVVNLKITVTINGSVPNLNAADDHTYKVVVIPPSAKIAGFDPKTYEEAKMVYGLED